MPSTTSASTRIASLMFAIGPGALLLLLLPPLPRSAPLQNSPPAPVSTMTRAPEKLSSRKVAPSATHMSPVHAFFVCGRSSVTVATYPSTSTRTFGSCDWGVRTPLTVQDVYRFRDELSSPRDPHSDSFGAGFEKRGDVLEDEVVGESDRAGREMFEEHGDPDA